MWYFDFILLAAAWLCQKTNAACGPVEEGQPSTLTCTVDSVACDPQNGLTLVLRWEAESVSISGPFVTQCTRSACGGPNIIDFLTTITGTSSTLTINSVSRITPFNMETKWTCSGFCDRREYLACNKLVVYARPEGRSCVVREVIQSGDIKSVTVICSTTKVYPKARCSFEWITNGGNPVTINKTPTYNHPTTKVTPAPDAPDTSTSAVYYMSECSVTVPVKDLGEGTHRFQGYIYPDVTGGRNLVNVTTSSETVTLRLPQVYYECSPQMIAGYFNGKSASCTCILQPGYPRGRAQWYKGNLIVSGVSDGVLDLAFDSSNPEQVYTCKAVSDIGESQGSRITAKFAFFDQNSIDVQPSPSSVDLCGDTNNQVSVTCRVPVEIVYPAPSFSFSLDGLEVVTSQVGSVNNGYYQHKYSLSSDNGGVYTVICRVTNTVLDQTQDKKTSVMYRKPPDLPPQINIDGQTYQGIKPSNIASLAAGYTGDVTCRVEGGYPSATITKLTCGPRISSGPDNVAALTFKNDPLTKDMDESVCTCTSQHAMPCYDKDTTLTLDVTYVPVIIFTSDTASLVFSEGDTPTFTCSVDGNPPPSVSLVRKRTQKQLASGQRNLKTAELTHTMDPLSCLDTDVYVCTGQNSRGTTKKEINIAIKCPQQLNSSVNTAVTGTLGGNAKINLEIYGYPEPRMINLVRTSDTAHKIRLARHVLRYTPSFAPLGFVDVTIYDLVKEDFTNYTITVDNGVGDAFTFHFYLKLTGSQVRDECDREANSAAIIIGVIAAVIITALVIVNIILVRRNDNTKCFIAWKPQQSDEKTESTTGPVISFSLTDTDPVYSECEFNPYTMSATAESHSPASGQNIQLPGFYNRLLPTSVGASNAESTFSDNYITMRPSSTTRSNTDTTVNNSNLANSQASAGASNIDTMVTNEYTTLTSPVSISNDNGKQQEEKKTYVNVDQLSSEDNKESETHKNVNVYENASTNA